MRQERFVCGREGIEGSQPACADEKDVAWAEDNGLSSSDGEEVCERNVVGH